MSTQALMMGGSLLLDTPVALSATADTSMNGTNSVVVASGTTNGTKIEEVVVIGNGSAATVAGLVCLFRFDGTTKHLYDTIQITAVTPSTTVTPFRTFRVYPNLWLPNASWQLLASSSVASQVIKVHALGSNA